MKRNKAMKKANRVKKAKARGASSYAVKKAAWTAASANEKKDAAA